MNFTVLLIPKPWCYSSLRVKYPTQRAQSEPKGWTQPSEEKAGARVGPRTPAGARVAGGGQRSRREALGSESGQEASVSQFNLKNG